MSSKLCAPYEGKQPYLYISCCPEDMDVILPIFRFLQGKGYRIGYDDSSASGSEWSGAAARRLDQSAVFLALSSKNWIASQKCLGEFTFAQMKSQPSLTVILEPVQLAPALKLQLESVPAIDRGQCTNKEFQNRLLEWLDKLGPDLRQDSVPMPSASRNKRPLAIAAAAVLIFLAGIAAVLLTHYREGALPDVPEETVTTSAAPGAGSSPSPEPELDYSAMYHILLTAPEDMPQEEFPEALSTLRGRLDIFTGGEPYEINVTDDSIELYLPKSAFAGLDVETVLKNFITSAAKLYIFDLFSPNTARESIRRDDLASVTLSHGTIPEVDVAQYGIDSTAYSYLTIRLTDQCAEWYGKEIAEWSDFLAFGQDMESVPDCVCYYTFPAGDGKTFYVLCPDFGDRYLEMLRCNWTRSPLPGNFLFTIDLNSLAAWQTTEGGSRMGENQCDPAALEDVSVTFILEGDGFQTAEDVLNAERELKACLDLLDQPYALGRIKNESEDIPAFAVRTGMEHMGMPVISLIGGGEVRLQTDYYSIYFPGSHFVWETAPDGSCSLALELRSNVTDSLKELTGEMPEQNNALYLTVGGVPVLRSFMERSVSDGRIIFDRLCFGQETEITEEYRWLTALLDRIVNGSSSVPQLHWGRQIQMNLGNEVIGYDRSRFGMSYAGAEQAFADAVYVAAPNASVTFQDVAVTDEQDLGHVYVSLDLALDETLPERAAALAREIYEASGFEQSIFQKLTIRLIEEDGSVNECARIVFQKAYTSVIPPIITRPAFPCGVYVSGMFRGERLKQHQTAFRHIVETDPFYVSLTLEGRTHWRW